MTSQGFTNEFLSQIVNLKNSYLLSLATIVLLSHNDIVTILKEDYISTGGYIFKFSDISNLIEKSKSEKNKDFETLTWEYLMFSTRSLFISLYAGFKDDEKRYNEVKELDWFVFLANIRHAVAHGVNAIWNIKNMANQRYFIYGKKIMLKS